MNAITIAGILLLPARHDKSASYPARVIFTTSPFVAIIRRKRRNEGRTSFTNFRHLDNPHGIIRRS